MAAASDVLFPQNQPGKLIRRLTVILDKALSHISTTTDTRRLNTFDEECAPLIALLLKLVDLAPEVVVQEMKEALLPSES